jgi:hypothetical protein
VGTPIKLRDGPWHGYTGEDVSLIAPQELVVAHWRYRKTSETVEVHDEEPGTERPRKRQGLVYVWDGCDPTGKKLDTL